MPSPKRRSPKPRANTNFSTGSAGGTFRLERTSAHEPADIVFRPSSAPTSQPEAHRSDPSERLRRSLTAMGNQATRGAIAAGPAGPMTEAGSSAPAERAEQAAIERSRQRARRQLRLRELLEPGKFTLESMVVGEDSVSIWAKTAAGVENVTDRFFPQPDENGVMQQPANIIRRRPESEGGDWSFAVRDLVVGGSDGKVRVLVERDDTSLRTKSNFTLEELTQPHPENPSKYWDLRPPIPFVELSRDPSIVNPPTPPPAPTA